jgi:predicted oxidoreductase
MRLSIVDVDLSLIHVPNVQMSPEQLGQLYELMHAAKDVWKPVQVQEEEKRKS